MPNVTSEPVLRTAGRSRWADVGSFTVVAQEPVGNEGIHGVGTSQSCQRKFALLIAPDHLAIRSSAHVVVQSVLASSGDDYAKRAEACTKRGDVG